MTDENQTQNEPQDLQKDLEQMTDIAKRALADLQNFKRQAAEERTQLMQMGKVTVLSDILPVLDNFNRAFEHTPPDLQENEWVNGMKNIKMQLEGLLTQSGLQEIATEGHVDPNLHEIVSTAPGEKDQIIQVLEKGYTLNGKVIRAAKVIVGTSA